MKISVITPSFNQGAFLQRTAGSILNQQGEFDLQWIIIDGGSTDQTLDFLASLNDARVHWISQPDRGQAHAINKGLAMATGDVVAWLNSDDLYAPGALAIVTDAFNAHPQRQWLAGRCQMIDADDQAIRSWVTRYKDRSLARYTYRRLLRENFISQPAVFWRNSFGQQVGQLDESLHWTMDYDLWLRMGRAAAPLIIENYLAYFRLHQASKSGQVDRRQFDEGYQVARRYLDQDRISRWVHRFNVEKIVLAYRLMQFCRR